MEKKRARCKDFEIVSFYCGSRLQGGPQWAYKVIYKFPDGSGRDKRFGGDFPTKEAAREYISKLVKATNEILKKKEEHQWNTFASPTT